MIPAASNLRGLDQGEYEMFALHFTWAAGMRTSMHKHNGFELVLVRSGRLNAIVDGTKSSAGATEFIELPAGSAHAIWSEVEVSFDVLGQSGLGLTMLVPEGDGKLREVPVYGAEGPWRQEPPPGMHYTTEAEMDNLRRLSQTLF
jgi:hypothetical protein